jgi:Fe-S-cluster containining protein
MPEMGKERNTDMRTQDALPVLQRGGSCTAGCGACCKSIRLQVPPEYGTNPDIKKWVELHGITVKEVGGGMFAFLNLPCSALTEEGMCSLMGTADRPELCSHWPATPEAMAGLEEVCTYSFTQEK